MTQAWVLMTALPPTLGHQSLIDFASAYPHVKDVYVLLCTQPGEPFVDDRYVSLYDHYRGTNVSVIKFYETIEQNPAAPGFRDMWEDILKRYGVTKRDLIFASEPYGLWVADLVGAKFIPYDMNREMVPVKATNIRKDIKGRWEELLPEFRKRIQYRVTIFGAESTGKTTLAKALAERMNGNYAVEYARPYLESTVNEITVDSMRDIMHGQFALQRTAGSVNPRPFLVQDTDLYSTLGYWEFPHWQETLGKPPLTLETMADLYKSDLYLITQSNIPFEKDPLRYGGDHREGSDEYWINVAKENQLNYVVLKDADLAGRLDQSTILLNHYWEMHTAKLRDYDRGGF